MSDSMKFIGVSAGALAKKVAELDIQFALFEKVKLSSTAAERNHFVLTDAAQAAASEGKEIDLLDLRNYRLVKRDSPIDIFDNGDTKRSVTATRESGAHKYIGLSAMSADESKLLLSGQMETGIDRSEAYGQNND